MTFLDTRDPGTGQYVINDPVTRLSEAFGINEGGVVVGRMAITPGGPKHAFRWIEGSGMQALGTLGGLESEALDVNDSGLIVGRSQVANGEWHACAYLNGSLVDLNTYVPAGVSAVLMRANRVNNQGQIVGDMRLNGSTNVYVLSLNPSATPATITQQPSSKTVALGETVTFSVTATGQLPIQYQWWRNNEKLATATNSVLTLESVNGLSEGEYRVDVINPGGSISSLPVSLTVLDPELTPYSLAGLSMVGEIGGMYRIDYRTTLSTPWVPLATVQLTNNPQWFIDLESATNRSRIYRSVRLGN
jgi:probable HAF family extracellular repeat protein